MTIEIKTENAHKVLRKKRKPRENKVEDKLVQAVKKRGGIAYKFKSPQHKNVPDRIILMPNTWYDQRTLNVDSPPSIFVECKRPGQKPTPAQYREHKRIRAIGHQVYVVSSYGEVNALIKQLFGGKEDAS